MGVIGDGVDWDREDCESRRTSCGVGGDRVCRGEPELLVEGEVLYASRDVPDDTVDIEMRDELGSFGCGKVDLVVVVVLEEKPLRSDTRLPLESSPYMAETFPKVNMQLAPWNFSSTPSPAIYLL